MKTAPAMTSDFIPAAWHNQFQVTLGAEGSSVSDFTPPQVKILGRFQWNENLHQFMGTYHPILLQDFVHLRQLFGMEPFGMETLFHQPQPSK